MSKKINALKNQAVKFLRDGDYSSLEAHMTADSICTEMHNLLAEMQADDAEANDPAFLSVGSFVSGVLVLDWVLWGDENVKKLGNRLARFLEASDKMLPDPEALRHATMDIVKIIKTDLTKVDKERLNTMAKAQFTTAVTSITMTCGEVVRVLS